MNWCMLDGFLLGKGINMVLTAWTFFQLGRMILFLQVQLEIMFSDLLDMNDDVLLQKEDYQECCITLHCI